MFSCKSKLFNRYLENSKNWFHYCLFLLVQELSEDWHNATNDTMTQNWHNTEYAWLRFLWLSMFFPSKFKFFRESFLTHKLQRCPFQWTRIPTVFQIFPLAGFLSLGMGGQENIWEHFYHTKSPITAPIPLLH